MSDAKKQHDEGKQENKQLRKKREEQREKKEHREHEHKNEQLGTNPKDDHEENENVKEPQKGSVFNIGDPIDTRVVRQKQIKHIAGRFPGKEFLHSLFAITGNTYGMDSRKER